MVKLSGLENHEGRKFHASSNLAPTARVLVVQLDRMSGSEPEDLRVRIPPRTLNL